MGYSTPRTTPTVVQTARGLIDGRPFGSFSVSDFGAVGDGETDDSSAIQAAIDAADAQSWDIPGQGYAAAPVVYIPAGVYRLANSIVLKGSSILGAGPQNGTRILWDGTAGGTAFTVAPVNTSAGNVSSKVLGGFSLGAGTAEVGTWLDLDGGGVVDALYQVDRIAFGSCSSDAVKIGPWVNVHWSNLRWDNCGGFAIRATPGASQYGSSFVLDQFTYDHSRADGPGRGFMLIDKSAGPNGLNIGPVTLANARIEVSQPWVGEKAVVTLKHGESVTQLSVPLLLSGISYHDVASMDDDVIVYRDAADTTKRESVTWLNCVFDSASALTGGTWAIGQEYPSPVVQSGALMGLSLSGLSIRARHDTPAVSIYPNPSQVEKLVRVFNKAGAETAHVDGNGNVRLVGNGTDLPLSVINNTFGAPSATFRNAARTGVTLGGTAHVTLLGGAGATLAGIYAGSGAPEGSVTAPPGSIYLRTSGGASTTFYVKESGTGDTGWVAK